VVLLIAAHGAPRAFDATIAMIARVMLASFVSVETPRLDP
jgi:hypothetical protein